MTAPLRVLVCMKVVLDPEASPVTLQIDAATNRVGASGTPPVLNPYDTNALAAALSLRAETEAAVTVLSVGPDPARPVFLKALAAGADAVLALGVPDDASAAADPQRTAARLATLVAAAGPYDLILAGRQAADTSAGVVGALLAGRLGLPLVTTAVAIRPASGAFCVERLTPRGRETVRVAAPALVTVSSEIGELAYPSLPGLRSARTKPFEVLDGDAESEAPAVEVVGLARRSYERECRMLPDGRALAAELAGRGLL